MYFPKHHKLHKIFNENTVKVSYSCTKNITSIINCHNKKKLHQNQPCPNQRKCNCIRKELCPLNRNCLAENIVYEATITCYEQNYIKNIYIGIAETTFKKNIVTIKDLLIQQGIRMILNFCKNLKNKTQEFCPPENGQWTNKHQRTNTLNYTHKRCNLRYLTESQIYLWNDFTISRYISLIQSQVPCHKRVCWFMCLHFEISCVLLLRMLFPLNNAISSFLFRQITSE